MERTLLGAAAVAAALLMVSCGIAEPHVSVLRGNYAFGQGRYQSATVDYLQALEHGQFEEWIAFNLGNVYHALGENESALGMWQVARRSDSDSLLFGVYYNTGLLLYEAGRYREAYDQFVEALRLNPTSIAGKINLELALERVQAGAAVASPRRSDAEEQNGAAADESRRILEYIRRREEQRWFAVDEIPAEESPRDW
ncbi:MAG: tetratricopeptide repeat protein [Spirochaetaceae bacterium]|nr:MAG: tetratricopeptide repeat protein [Spirochaetaceae bacterium]